MFKLFVVMAICIVCVRTQTKQDYDEANQNGLETHNRYRNMYSAKKLALDEALIKSAQDRANYLATDNNAFENTIDTAYGENIFRYKGKKNSFNSVTFRSLPSIATLQWSSYAINYDFKSGTLKDQSAKMFTQIVWKSTNNVGFGIAYNSKSDTYFVVAYYSPKGNTPGQYLNNVSARQSPLV